MNMSSQRNFGFMISSLGPACPERSSVKTLASSETAECVRNIRYFKNTATTSTAETCPKNPPEHAGAELSGQQTPRAPRKWYGTSPAFDASQLHASARTLYQYAWCDFWITFRRLLRRRRRSQLTTLRTPGAASGVWAVREAP